MSDVFKLIKGKTIIIVILTEDIQTLTNNLHQWKERERNLQHFFTKISHNNFREN